MGDDRFAVLVKKEAIGDASRGAKRLEVAISELFGNVGR